MVPRSCYKMLWDQRRCVFSGSIPGQRPLYAEKAYKSMQPKLVTRKFNILVSEGGQALTTKSGITACEESTYRWTMTGQWPSSDWLRLKCNFWSASLILFSKKTVICIFCQKPYYIKPFPNLKNNWSKPELTLTPKKFIWRVYEVYILIVYVENDF